MTKKIVWEDYNANFVDDDDDSNINDDLYTDTDGDDFNEDDEGIDSSIINSKGAGFFTFTQTLNDLGVDVVQTPFGPYNKSNRWAPFNFYEMKLIHLYGFSANTDPEFGLKLDSIDGIAAWRCIDPYCFIIAKAKLYKWPEVQLNLEIKFGLKSSDNEKIRQSVLEIKEKGQNNIAIIYPNGEYDICQYTEETFNALYDKYKNIVDILYGSKILVDGEIYFEN